MVIAQRAQLDHAEALFRDMGMDWWTEQAEGLRGRLNRGEPFKWFAPNLDGHIQVGAHPGDLPPVARRIREAFPPPRCGANPRSYSGTSFRPRRFPACFG